MLTFHIQSAIILTFWCLELSITFSLFFIFFVSRQILFWYHWHNLHLIKQTRWQSQTAIFQISPPSHQTIYPSLHICSLSSPRSNFKFVKISIFCQIWSFLDRWFGRYNILSKNWNSPASKLIQCPYNCIKTIGNKAMVSALAPAILSAQKIPKMPNLVIFGPLFQPLQLLDQKLL